MCEWLGRLERVATKVMIKKFNSSMRYLESGVSKHARKTKVTVSVAPAGKTTIMDCF